MRARRSHVAARGGLLLVLLMLVGASAAASRRHYDVDVASFHPTSVEGALAAPLEWRFQEGVEGDFCAKCAGELLRDEPECHGKERCVAEVSRPPGDGQPLALCTVMTLDRPEPPVVLKSEWDSSRTLHAIAVSDMPVGYYMADCKTGGGNHLVQRTVAVGVKPFAFNASMWMISNNAGWAGRHQNLVSMLEAMAPKVSSPMGGGQTQETAVRVIGGVDGLKQYRLMAGIADLAACVEEAQIVVVGVLPVIQDVRGKPAVKPKASVRKFWLQLIEELESVAARGGADSIRYRLLPSAPGSQTVPHVWVLRKSAFESINVEADLASMNVAEVASVVVRSANNLLQRDIADSALDDKDQSCLVQPPGEKRAWHFPICPSVTSVSVALPEGDHGVEIVSSPADAQEYVGPRLGSVSVSNGVVTYVPRQVSPGVTDSFPVLLRSGYGRYLVDSIVLEFTSASASFCIGRDTKDGTIDGSGAPDGTVKLTVPDFQAGRPSSYEAATNKYCESIEEMDMRARELSLWPYHRKELAGTTVGREAFVDARAEKDYSSCSFSSYPVVHEEDTYVPGKISFRSVDAASIGLTEKQAERYKVAPGCTFDLHLSARSHVPGEFCIFDRVIAPVSAGDYDLDGYPDVFTPASLGGGRLFRNMHDGTFMDVSRAAGIAEAFDEMAARGQAPVLTSSSFLDVDNDGDIDIFCTIAGKTVTHQMLFVQQDDELAGTFVEEGLVRGLGHSDAGASGVIDSSFGDFDGDGYVDILTLEWLPLSRKGGYASNRLHSHSRLLRNLGADGPGVFRDVTVEVGLNSLDFWKRTLFHVSEGDYALSAIFADMDGDGWQDILWVGDFGLSTIFWSTCGDTEEGVRFVEEDRDCGVSREENGMGSTAHDVNGDGLLDYFVSSIHADSEVSINCKDSLECAFGKFGNKLYLNQGNRTFTEAAGDYGLDRTYWSWGCDFVDFDHDTDLDFYLVNGFHVPGTTVEDHFNTRHNYLMLNPAVECQASGSVSGYGSDTSCSPIPGQSAGQFVFQDVSHAVGFASVRDAKAAAVADFNADGVLDIVVGVTSGRVEMYLGDLGDGYATTRFLRVIPRKTCGSVAWNARIEVYLTADTEVPMIRVMGASSSHYESQSESVAHFGLGSATTVDRVVVRFPRPSQSVVTLTNVSANQILSVYDNGEDATLEYDSHVRIECSGASLGHARTVDLPGQGSISPGSGPSPCITRGTLCPADDPERQQGSGGIALPLSLRTEAAPSAAYSANGKSNNLAHPSWGASGTLYRLLPASYTDGVSQPPLNRPSTRLISNELCAEVEGKPKMSANHVSQLHVDWGQFLAHDMTLANPLGMTMLTDNTYPIPVPKGDIIFDLENTVPGKEVLRFSRTTFDESTGTDPLNPRQQVNHHSSFVDASNVYSPSADRMAELRTGDGGKLRSSTSQETGEELLPMKELSGLARDNPTGRQERNLFVAGDHRANEQPGLLALHTLFLREHNRLCDELAALHPSWSDERLFQRARALVIAEIQAVTMEEYLPALVGPTAASAVSEACQSYDATTRPDVYNAFAAAAFRFGHSAVGNSVVLAPLEGEETHVSLRDSFFIPEHILVHGIDAVLNGQLRTLSREVDLELVSDLRNFLFGNSRHLGGLDLAALNIQRGRDHGLPDYNSARAFFGLSTFSAFSELPFPEDVRQKLAQLYADVSDIDLFVGGLLEVHEDGSSLGELFTKMVSEQFRRLCVGDRMWYSNGLLFNEDEITELRAARLGDILARNTGIREEDVFHA